MVSQSSGKFSVLLQEYSGLFQSETELLHRLQGLEFGCLKADD